MIGDCAANLVQHPLAWGWGGWGWDWPGYYCDPYYDPYCYYNSYYSW
jgi:hypothetical protein